MRSLHKTLCEREFSNPGIERDFGSSAVFGKSVCIYGDKTIEEVRPDSTKTPHCTISPQLGVRGREEEIQKTLC